MTPMGQETETIDLSDDEFAVAATIEAIATATQRPVRRTALLAIIEAARERPSLTEAEPIRRLDREQVADTLLTLRARSLATLGDGGFSLTARGAEGLGSRGREGSFAAFVTELQGLVGTKFTEWSMV